jgi:hypothetical protein
MLNRMQHRSLMRLRLVGEVEIRSNLCLTWAACSRKLKISDTDRHALGEKLPSRKREPQSEARETAQRPLWQEGEEPQAGYCHRSLGGENVRRAHPSQNEHAASKSIRLKRLGQRLIPEAMKLRLMSHWPLSALRR